MKTTDVQDVDLQEYARKPAPETSNSSGFHLALIIIGGTIGFAIFIVAAQIGGSLGYAKAGTAFAIGSLILGIMGAMTSYIGAKTRLSTYLLTEFAFGQQGAKLVNLAIAASLIGWYGVISSTLGQATTSMLSESFGIHIPEVLAVIVASALMIWVTVIGFKGVDKLALVLVPLMILFIAFAAYMALAKADGSGQLVEAGFTFKTAISAVVGSYIAGVIIQPDYSRFAVNPRQAVVGVFLALGVMFPLIQFFSAVPSMALGEPDIVQVMVGLGIILPAFFLLFLGAWSSNVLCLYSSGLSVATIAKRTPFSKIIIVIGIIGTALAFLPAQTYLVNFLVLLGVAIPPIGAVYIVETAFFRRFKMNIEALTQEPVIRWQAFVAWISGGVIGYLSSKGVVGVFDIASIDSLVVSSLVYIALNFTRFKRA